MSGLTLHGVAQCSPDLIRGRGQSKETGIQHRGIDLHQVHSHIYILDDAKSRTSSFEVATDIEPEKTRWVVIADYRPPGSTGAFDTLQAVSGP